MMGIATGNTLVLGFFAKRGFLIFSGKPKKDMAFIRRLNNDMVGFINIPSAVYAPIFVNEGGKYKHHDFLGRKNPAGELSIDDSQLAKRLDPLANAGVGVFKDLTIVRGAINTKSKSLATSKFTTLIKYVNTDLKKHHPIISLYEGGEERKFTLVYAVEMTLEEKKEIDFSSRKSFLDSFRRLSFYDSREVITSNVLILNGFTGIDSVLLVLQEKE